MRAGRWRTAVRGASLRTRVMAAAALLVALTCLVTAVLGTTLLRSYLLSRSDAQLRDFAKVASRIVERQQLQPGGDSSRPQALPTQFLVEVIGAGRADQHGGRAAGRGGRTAAVRGAAQRCRNAVHRCGRRRVGGLLARPGAAAIRRRSSGHRLQSRRSRQHGHPPGDSRRAGRSRLPSFCWPASACRWCGPAWRRWRGSRRRPRRSRAVTCPGASTIRPGTPRSGGWPKRWM